jgi:tetratricopeptide (TPR) repeat protein
MIMLPRTPKSGFFCVALIGFIGVFSFLSPAERPEDALNRFAAAFVGRDSEALGKMVHPDVAEGKELRKSDISAFLDRFKGIASGVREIRILKRFTSEDGKTERCEASLVFDASATAPGYDIPMTLNMKLLWVLEEKRWWYERPMELHYTVSSSWTYPTRDQEDVGARFQAALDTLDKLEQEETVAPLYEKSSSGETAAVNYNEMSSLYAGERGAKGPTPDARGVDALLKGATKPAGSLLKMFHGDFKASEDDTRPPVPWDAFRDYVRAAVERAKSFERRGDSKKAEEIYRRVYSLGGQLLAEPGGLLFLTWGASFQEAGAKELARMLVKRAHKEAERYAHAANLASRKLELAKTAMSALEDTTDYHSLKAAIIAANRKGDVNFRPWGVRTLVLYALKGAPAKTEIMRKVNCLTIVRNLKMQEVASRELDTIAAEPTGRVKAFVERQKARILSEKSFAAMGGFK